MYDILIIFLMHSIVIFFSSWSALIPFTNFKMSMFFNGMKQGETLEKFLDRVVRPDTEFLEDCGEVIDTVVRRIHKLRHPKYSVNNVIKVSIT